MIRAKKSLFQEWIIEKMKKRFLPCPIFFFFLLFSSNTPLNKTKFFFSSPIFFFSRQADAIADPSGAIKKYCPPLSAKNRTKEFFFFLNIKLKNDRKTKYVIKKTTTKK